jgi:hypothetical protein
LKKQKAVRYGIELAKKYEAELSEVHSIHHPFGLEGWNIPLPSLPGLEHEYKRMQEEVRRDLDEMINKESGPRGPGFDLPQRERLKVLRYRAQGNKTTKENSFSPYALNLFCR